MKAWALFLNVAAGAVIVWIFATLTLPGFRAVSRALDGMIVR
jgi:hypothetical protein